MSSATEQGKDPSKLLVGTRGSRLARAQSGMVAELIEKVTGVPTGLVTVRTDGDDLSIPLSAPPRPGAFAARLRDVLQAGEVDIAVHSFKDLPFQPAEGLSIVAVPLRARPVDALVSRDNLKLDELPSGARIGTSSPRRAMALLRYRADVEIVPIRGNVDTRVRKVRDGEVDAAILAAAGLDRIDRGDEIAELIAADIIVPAPAQGALAIEMRSDHPLAGAVAQLDDADTRLRITAEREVLIGVQATCTTAIGAYAELDGNDLTLTADLTGHMGVDHARVSRTISLHADEASSSRLADARKLGAEVSAELLKTRSRSANMSAKPTEK